MKEFVIQVPDGYVVKVGIWVVLIVIAALVFPYYKAHLDRVSAATVVTQAQAQAEARRILEQGASCR